jgi:hypothetical protein
MVAAAGRRGPAQRQTSPTMSLVASPTASQDFQQAAACILHRSYPVTFEATERDEAGELSSHSPQEEATSPLQEVDLKEDSGTAWRDSVLCPHGRHECGKVHSILKRCWESQQLSPLSPSPPQSPRQSPSQMPTPPPPSAAPRSDAAAHFAAFTFPGSAGGPSLTPRVVQIGLKRTFTSTAAAESQSRPARPQPSAEPRGNTSPADRVSPSKSTVAAPPHYLAPAGGYPVPIGANRQPAQQLDAFQAYIAKFASAPHR